MYPGSSYNWHDNSSNVNNKSTETIDNSPLYFAVSSFDRGPEDVRVVSRDFYKLYGSKMNFDRHGQPAIQIANIIDGGGRVLLKRLVAEDALLANVIGVANIKEKISTVKAAEGDINGKTLNEIITGKPDVVLEYAENLDLVSSVGATDDSTSITVDGELGEGNSYKWRITDSEILPVLNSTANGLNFISWDGVSDIAVADGTKIQVIEVNNKNNILKSGVINVVSKIPNPAKTSDEPTNDLPALFVTSKEGTNEGYSELIVSPSIEVGNQYYYKIIPSGEQIVFPSSTDILLDTELENWVAWNGNDQLQLEEGTKIVLIEVASEDEDPEFITYKAVKGASISIVIKRSEDTRTSVSVEGIVPSEQKYIVSGQSNFVKWEAVSITNCKTLEDVLSEARKLFVSADAAVVQEADSTIITKSSSYPLFVATDNGRGVSNKAIRFVPDYATSKDSNYVFYNVYVYEGTSKLEDSTCTINPSGIFNNVLYGLNMETSEQVKFEALADVYGSYINHLVNITGYSANDLNKFDVLFFTNNKGVSLNNIQIESDSVDFSASYGINLDNGSNGEFGDKPFGTEAYVKAAVDVIKGKFDDVVWDRDTYKICAIFDANYPDKIKEAFAEFVTFREDCVFFRDYGTSISTYAAIVEKYNSISEDHKNKFILDYYTTYQIYDPETKARERVTMMYDFARVMISHFANGTCKPMAGVVNGMILSSAIEGTINFTPRVTPTVDQKSLLDDLRVNYAIFEEGRCVVQSLYTSQLKNTELSYGNNVLAIQEVIRAIRVACPKQRFTFTSGADFTSYADAVNNVLKGFKSNFAMLEFAYEQNNLKAAQKIFYAVINFKFNTWAQSEQFDLFALSSNQ